MERILKATIFLTLLTLSASSQTKMDKDLPQQRPHIVFIMADDMGYNDIGYHNPEIKSYFLNRLSAQGVRLENYYVQPVCSPSRGQLMSGRYQIHTGLQHKNIPPTHPSGLPLDSPTLADKLKDAGYSTHMIGKWHLGFFKKDYLPTRRGFETFFGTYTGSANHFTFRKCIRRKCSPDLHNDTTSSFNTVHLKSRKPTETYSTHLFTRRAVDIIEAHRHEEDKPLFLYLSYTAVHGPLQVPRMYLDMNRHIRPPQRRAFAAMVTALDFGAGKVVGTLKSAGMWNNTLLIFSSDNGGIRRVGGSNFPLRGQKGSYLEGGIRAVGFVSGPLISKTNYSSRQLMHISDWYPTLVNLAGGDLMGAKQLAGHDQWAALSRGHRSKRNVILHNIDPLTRVRRRRPQIRHKFDTRILAAIRVGDFKLLTGQHGGRQVQLFNVRKSPRERFDLSRALRARVFRMLTMLHKFQKTAVKPLWSRPDSKHGPVRTGRWEPWRT